MLIAQQWWLTSSTSSLRETSQSIWLTNQILNSHYKALSVIFTINLRPVFISKALLPYWTSHEYLLQSLQNVSQPLVVVLVVFFAVFPQVQWLILILHKSVPGVGEVQRLHYSDLTASSMQSLQSSLDLCFLPLKQTSGKDAQLDVSSGL